MLIKFHLQKAQRKAKFIYLHEFEKHHNRPCWFSRCCEVVIEIRMMQKEEKQVNSLGNYLLEF